GTCRKLTIRWTVSIHPAPRTSAAALNEKTKNDSAHLRGGRHSSRAGRSLSGSVSIQLWLSAAQSVSGHSALPHRCAGRSSRCLPKLRSSGHLIQLVQKSALPQVPDARARALVGGSRTRTPDHQLLPCCVHCASRTQWAGPSVALADPQQFANLMRRLHRHDWVVYAKPAFGGTLQVLRYLGRYTHRVAISNHRLLAFAQELVTFRWKDYAHGGKQGKMTLLATEFLRRFFLHVLPRGFVRIRHFGFLANRFRASRLALSQQLLSSNSTPPAEVVICANSSQTSPLWHCPRCGAAMIVMQRFTAAELSTCSYFDSS